MPERRPAPRRKAHHGKATGSLSSVNRRAKESRAKQAALRQRIKDLEDRVEALEAHH